MSNLLIPPCYNEGETLKTIACDTITANESNHASTGTSELRYCYGQQAVISKNDNVEFIAFSSYEDELTVYYADFLENSCIKDDIFTGEDHDNPGQTVTIELFDSLSQALKEAKRNCTIYTINEIFIYTLKKDKDGDWVPTGEVTSAYTEETATDDADSLLKHIRNKQVIDYFSNKAKQLGFTEIYAPDPVGFGRRPDTCTYSLVAIRNTIDSPDFSLAYHRDYIDTLDKESVFADIDDDLKKENWYTSADAVKKAILRDLKEELPDVVTSFDSKELFDKEKTILDSDDYDYLISLYNDAAEIWRTVYDDTIQGCKDGHLQNYGLGVDLWFEDIMEEHYNDAINQYIDFLESYAD